MKATMSPLGENTGSELYVPWKVSRSTFLVPRSMRYICGVPARDEQKASVLPSGDMEGDVSVAQLLVSRWGSPPEREDR